MFRSVSPRLIVGAAVALAVALAIAPLALTAQAPARRAAAAGAVAGYKLTMGDVRRFGATLQEIGAAIKANPKLEERLTSTPDESVEQIATRLAGVPQFRPAFAKSGMTPRQFAVTQYTILGAGMAVGMPRGQKTPEQLVQQMGIDPANVAFMRAHGAEVKALFQQLAAAKGDDAEQRDDEEAEDPAR